MLNASAVGEALLFRPDVTLSMHVVASPAAFAIKQALGVPVVQYFHAEEIGARPRLAAFAANRADAAIAVSAYTAGLVRATGAAGANITVIANGVDLPATIVRGGRPRARARRPPHLPDRRAHPGALQGPRRARARAGAGAGEGPRRAVGRVRGRLAAPGDRSARRAPTASRTPPASSARSPTSSATRGCVAPTCSRCPAACRRAGSRARASGSSTWRPARTASRSSPATSAAPWTPSSTESPGCSSTHSTSWRSRRRSPICCSIRSWRGGWARPGGGAPGMLAWPLVVQRVQDVLLGQLAR